MRTRTWTLDELAVLATLQEEPYAHYSPTWLAKFLDIPLGEDKEGLHRVHEAIDVVRACKWLATDHDPERPKGEHYRYSLIWGTGLAVRRAFKGQTVPYRWDAERGRWRDMNDRVIRERRT